MPNWSFNTIALQGSKESVHQFIKEGLKNSNLKSTKDISKDFDLLVEKAKTKESVELNKGALDGLGEIVYNNTLTARTFLPMPDTFLTHDTTNYASKYPEVADAQKKKYGAVGWYDYNIKTLGTKWNFELENITLQDLGEDKYRITFTCQTAWSIPENWLITMSHVVPNLQIGISAVEESNAYAFCGYVGSGSIIDYADVSADIEEYYEKYNKKYDARYDELKADKKAMESLREEAIASLKERGDVVLTSDVIKDVTDSHLRQKVYAEIGYPDESEVTDSLDEKFDSMLSEILVA